MIERTKYHNQIVVRKTDMVIACATCKFDKQCRRNLKNSHGDRECLDIGEPKKYYNWPIYQNKYKYSRWMPKFPYPENQILDDKLFEI